MRCSFIRMAKSISKAPLNLTEASAMLYPPLPYVQLSKTLYIANAKTIHVDCTGVYCGHIEICQLRCVDWEMIM